VKPLAHGFLGIGMSMTVRILLPAKRPFGQEKEDAQSALPSSLLSEFPALGEKIESPL
jgi:hypothetical protein